MQDVRREILNAILDLTGSQSGRNVSKLHLQQLFCHKAPGAVSLLTLMPEEVFRVTGS